MSDAKRIAAAVHRKGMAAIAAEIRGRLAVPAPRNLMIEPKAAADNNVTIVRGPFLSAAMDEVRQRMQAQLKRSVAGLSASAWHKDDPHAPVAEVAMNPPPPGMQWELRKMHDEQRQKFWMVMVDGQGPPKKRHATKAEAAQEAERLAKLRPGVTVYVLKAAAAVIADQPDPYWLTITPPLYAADVDEYGIPF